MPPSTVKPGPAGEGGAYVIEDAYLSWTDADSGAEVRAERGEVRTDIPQKSIKRLLTAGQIRPATAADQRKES